MQWITSDTHFWHKKIFGKEGFCSSRKHFTSVEEMNETIIENWNSVVGGEDTVYHLGDIAIGKRSETLELIKRLNGTIYFVKGNHDSRRDFKFYAKESPTVKNHPKFQFIPMGTVVKRKGVQYYLTHFPQRLGQHRGAIRNLCGHIHEEVASDANVLNVGVDSPEISELDSLFGAPVLLDEAMDLLDRKHKKYLETLTREGA